MIEFDFLKGQGFFCVSLLSVLYLCLCNKYVKEIFANVYGFRISPVLLLCQFLVGLKFHYVYP